MRNLHLKISLALICMFVLVVTLTGAASVGKLTKVLSLSKMMSSKSTNEVDYSDPNQYESPEAILPKEGKSNIISQALRMIHKRSGAGLKRSESAKETKSGSKKAVGLVRSKSLDSKSGTEDSRTDEEILKGACQEEPSKTCDLFVKLALKRSPEVQHKIAIALKSKCDSVGANRLLSHKLFESAIRDVEEKNIDEKIDLVADLLVNKNPYAWVGMKAAKVVLKPILKSVNKSES